MDDENQSNELNPENIEKIKILIVEIHHFEDRFKKSTKKLKEHKGSTETNYSNTGIDMIELPTK
jgi:hypothetical protein